MGCKMYDPRQIKGAMTNCFTTGRRDHSKYFQFFSCLRVVCVLVTTFAWNLGVLHGYDGLQR